MRGHILPDESPKGRPQANQKVWQKAIACCPLMGLKELKLLTSKGSLFAKPNV